VGTVAERMNKFVHQALVVAEDPIDHLDQPPTIRTAAATSGTLAATSLPIRYVLDDALCFLERDTPQRYARSHPALRVPKNRVHEFLDFIYRVATSLFRRGRPRVEPVHIDVEAVRGHNRRHLHPAEIARSVNVEVNSAHGTGHEGIPGAYLWFFEVLVRADQFIQAADIQVVFLHYDLPNLVDSSRPYVSERVVHSVQFKRVEVVVLREQVVQQAGYLPRT
jgi:hypothetical protein